MSTDPTPTRPATFDELLAKTKGFSEAGEACYAINEIERRFWLLIHSGGVRLVRELRTAISGGELPNIEAELDRVLSILDGTHAPTKDQP